MQERQLREYAEASARLWNIANYQRRQALFKGLGLPDYSSQCKALKATMPFKALGTCKAQALLAKLNEAWGSYLALKRLERRRKLTCNIRKVELPRYLKDRHRRTLIAESIYVRKDGYRQIGQILVLSKKLRIGFKAGDLWVGEQGRLELHYDQLRRRWYGRIPVKVKWSHKGRPHHPTPKRASIDLGICNLATCVVERSPIALVYSGRAVLSDWTYCTKRIASEQQRLAKVNGKRASTRLKGMFRRRTRRLHHAIDAMLRDLFERLEADNLTELVVGDLKHIRINARDHGRVGNQKLHNFWVFQEIHQRIVELGEEYGIKVRFKSERDSSKRCSICGQKHGSGRMHRGLYRCMETSQMLNADVNGALNILYGRKVAALSGSRPMARPMLLRWDGREWNHSNGMPTHPRNAAETRISALLSRRVPKEGIYITPPCCPSVA